MSLFTIRKSTIIAEANTYVSWDSSVGTFVKSYILLDLLFAVIKCNRVGIAVKLNGGEIDILWVDDNQFWQDKSKNYSHYLQDMYNITGVLFEDDQKAIDFHQWLEKKYMWETLSA